MSVPRTIHRHLAQLVLCVMVFGGLAPTVSRALSQGRVDWIEVCTSSGTQRVAVVDGVPVEDDAPKSSHGHGDSDCGYCLLLQHSPTLLTLGELSVKPPMCGVYLPVGSSGATIVRRLVYEANPPRAPPVA